MEKKMKRVAPRGAQNESRPGAGGGTTGGNGNGRRKNRTANNAAAPAVTLREVMDALTEFIVEHFDDDLSLVPMFEFGKGREVLAARTGGNERVWTAAEFERDIARRIRDAKRREARSAQDELARARRLIAQAEART